MPHPDLKRSVTVEPPLEAHEIELLRSLAGVGLVRRIWRGQPGSRSPWLPCGGGCCLVAQHRSARDLAVWMRFLLRELLSPRTTASVSRAAAAGLLGGHRVSGQVEVKAGATSRLVVVRSNRVTERASAGRGQTTER